MTDHPVKIVSLKLATGDYTRYSYGPYVESEESWITQALRDRMPPKLLDGEYDIESNFSTLIAYCTRLFEVSKIHSIVFKFGDLQEGNLLVRADGNVVLLGVLVVLPCHE
ncbi:kinase-like protein [Penicillium odoratum]|uniref:kinase-like protein n=1 Tax=Penicillium odoratum TaxID=1167516 RepID=UPI0025477762|nr:kinase-like protein [Penicillium odoratum]KAJ5777520.1 kinase-like protein [Penicillium odoratum]